MNRNLFDIPARDGPLLWRRLRPLLDRLPLLHGKPITVHTCPGLRVVRGRLRGPAGSGGVEVHAAAGIRARRLLIEEALLENQEEFERIFTHELFHFVWVRLSNARRFSFEKLIAAEFDCAAPGELGWSAELGKAVQTAVDRRRRTRKWRAYVCEAFCDTAAWSYSGGGSHPEFTLESTSRRRRRGWLRDLTAQSERIAI